MDSFTFQKLITLFGYSWGGPDSCSALSYKLHAIMRKDGLIPDDAATSHTKKYHVTLRIKRLFTNHTRSEILEQTKLMNPSFNQTFFIIMFG